MRVAETELLGEPAADGLLVVLLEARGRDREAGAGVLALRGRLARRLGALGGLAALRGAALAALRRGAALAAALRAALRPALAGGGALRDLAALASRLTRFFRRVQPDTPFFMVVLS